MEVNKKLKAKLIIKEILEYLPKRKVLSVISNSKEYHQVMGIEKHQRKILKVIYETPFAPLHYTTRFSTNSKHINEFLYNKLLDYYQLLKDQLPNQNEQEFKKLYIEYLKTIKNNNSLCMIDFNDDEGLNLAKAINNLEYGIFDDFSKHIVVKDLTGLNLVFYSGNLQTLSNNLLNQLLDELAKCPLKKMRITFPTNIPFEKFSKLPRLKKLEMVNYWDNSQQLLNALESVKHMGNSLESLTIYSIKKVIEESNIRLLKEKLFEFKNIKHLYIRQFINDKINYKTFVDLFQSFSSNLLKIKLDNDIFISNVPITFNEFPKLKKLIIKLTDINNMNIFNIRNDIDFQIKYSKVVIYDNNINNLNDKNNAYELILDEESFSENEYAIINTAINNPNVRSMSFRCNNSKSILFLSDYKNPNLKELELNCFTNNLDLSNVFRNNPNITTLKLLYIGDYDDDIVPDNNSCNIVFPNKETKINNMEIYSAKIFDIRSFFIAFKHIKILNIDKLYISEDDFEYFVKHFNELQELKSLFLGSINYIGNQNNMLNYMYIFFESISKIKGFSHLEFRTDIEYNLDFIKVFATNLGYMLNLKYLKITAIENTNCFDVRKLLFQVVERLKKLKEFHLLIVEK